MLPARILIATVAATLALAGVASAQTITTQQADDILKELRAIRHAIERQQAPASVAQQAASLKLDTKQFDTCTTGTEYDTAISMDMTEGAGFSVNGTPTFFVGKTTAQGFEGFRIVGAQPFAVFQQRIEGLLK